MKITLTEKELIQIIKKSYRVGSAAGYDKGRNKQRKGHYDTLEGVILDVFLDLELENKDLVLSN